VIDYSGGRNDVNADENATCMMRRRVRRIRVAMSSRRDEQDVKGSDTIKCTTEPRKWLETR
jgi:hypothetical protein